MTILRRRPLTSFFVLACTLSWVAWTPYVLSENGLGLWAYRFPEVLGTSQILGVLPGAYLGPIASAFLVTALVDGRPGLRRWIGRMGRWRVGGRWYAIALLGVPAVLLVAGTAQAGGAIVAPSLTALAMYVPGLVLQVVTTGLAEEPGWRDFALPRLQGRLGALRASFVLGPVWALWHAPLFLTEWGGRDTTWISPLNFLIFTVAFTVVVTWLFNRSGESLPVAVLAHVSVNNTASVLWGEMFPTIDGDGSMQAMAAAATVAAALVVIGTRGRLGLPDRAEDRQDLSSDTVTT
ncbi:type II CAAX endopeptidase family protein [Actinomycetospora sp. OC33-EN08]|uniref:Type II CAAX endopeptidase family protein n=1 Tax=Actinomycetospora aurantiaca TaxID=3129233 RepID=A0ABU8MN71_9PSEU